MEKELPAENNDSINYRKWGYRLSLIVPAAVLLLESAQINPAKFSDQYTQDKNGKIVINHRNEAGDEDGSAEISVSSNFEP